MKRRGAVLLPCRDFRAIMSMRPAPRALLPRLQVFTGPMWSGKTRELVMSTRAVMAAGPGRLAPPKRHRSPVRHAAQATGFDAVLFLKHSIDTRAGVGTIASRCGLRLEPAMPVACLDDVQVAPRSVVAVDEAQFLGDDLLRFAERFVEDEELQECALLVSGLDLDYEAQPFGHVGSLARWAQQQASDGSVSAAVRRMAARCTFGSCGGSSDRATGGCSSPALFSQRLAEGGAARVHIGGGEAYQPACGAHHSPSPVPAGWWFGDEHLPRAGGVESVVCTERPDEALASTGSTATAPA